MDVDEDKPQDDESGSLVASDDEAEPIKKQSPKKTVVRKVKRVVK
jgi:hypothetical protein